MGRELQVQPIAVWLTLTQERKLTIWCFTGPVSQGTKELDVQSKTEL